MTNLINALTSQPRDEMIRILFNEALDRVLKEEDVDPAMAICSALLLNKEDVDSYELEVVLKAHQEGPWAVNTTEKMKIFSKWCDLSESPLEINDPVTVFGIPVYRDDFGDCCLQESSLGHHYAVWTRKGRLHVGFRYPAQASAFRDSPSQLYSMEATGNKRLSLVVLEGGDTPGTIQSVAERLLYQFSL